MTTDLIEPPEPGVYVDVPMDEYHRWDAASNTQLGKLNKSPKHLKAYREDEFEETSSMKLGRMIHMAVLEPDLFEETYVVLGDCEDSTKSGKPCTNSAKGVYNGDHKCGIHGSESELDEVENVKESHHETAMEIQESIEDSTAAMSLLSGEGANELSGVWEDDATGVTCRFRADRHSQEVPGGAIIDLKTCGDASRESFRKDIFRYGYHRQGELYLRGARALDVPAEDFIIIAAEKSPPYAVATYRVTDLIDERIQGHVTELLQLYQKCQEEDHWPGYPDRLRDISIPSWGWDAIETQRNDIQRLKEAV